MRTRLIVSLLSLGAIFAFANEAAQNQVAPTPVPPTQYNNPQPYQGYYGLPKKAMDTIQKTYPGVYIKDIDFKAYGFKVELANFMEMYFDRDGNFLGQKWDD